MMRILMIFEHKDEKRVPLPCNPFPAKRTCPHRTGIDARHHRLCVSTSSVNRRNPIYLYIAHECYCFFFSSYYVARDVYTCVL